jgi:SAM-dependent methyltransferase
MNEKEILRKAFFETIPQARRQMKNPFFNSIFEFMYDAHLRAKQGTTLLNIYSSRDNSESRRGLYEEKFFNNAEISGLDFWEDHFIKDGTPTDGHTLPYPDNYFDTLVTTKYFMEHITDPNKVMSEMCRVLKPGGVAYIVAAHAKAQHQKPHDYLRYTEYMLEFLAKKAGFSQWEIKPTDGFFFLAAFSASYFERSLQMPHFLKWFFDAIHAHVLMPIGFFLQHHDNGRGRDLSSHFTLKATK